MVKWMRLKTYSKTTGIPESLVQEALHGQHKNRIGRKMHPDKKNSPYLINVTEADKLFARNQF